MKKIFTLFSMIVICLSANAQYSSFELREGDSGPFFSIPFDSRSSVDLNNDGQKDTWLSGNGDILMDAAYEEWQPEVGESFTLYMKGVSKVSGKLMMVIADSSYLANGWIELSSRAEIDLVEGKEFEFNGYFSINNTTKLTMDGQFGNAGDEAKQEITRGLLYFAVFPTTEIGQNEILFECSDFSVNYQWSGSIVVLHIPDITAEVGAIIPRIKLSDYFLIDEGTKMQYSSWIEEDESQEYFEENALFRAKVINGELSISAFAAGEYHIEIMGMPVREEGNEQHESEGRGSVRVVITERHVENVETCNIELKETIKNVTCGGDRDGSIVVVASGGVEPYSYRWSTGRTDNGIYHMSGGMYSLVVEDSVGCMATGIYEIEELSIPSDLYPTIYAYPTCNGKDGIVKFDDEDVQDYTFKWDDGVESSAREDLSAKMYKIEVSDKNGCSKTIDFPLSNLDISSYSYDYVKCGNSDGTISYYIYRGTAPYSYYIDDNEVEADEDNYRISGMSIGKHKLTIIDAEGCQGDQMVTVSKKYVPQPEIYSVSYAEDSKSIIVMWTFDSSEWYEDPEDLKEYMNNIDYFTIYRETSEQKGDYDSIGFVKSTFPLYQDYDLSESNASHRYKISSTDYCGETTPMSYTENKSIGLTMTTEATDNGKTRVNLSWTPYEGQFFDSYSIYRKTKSKNLEVAKIAPNKTSYSEIVPAGTRGYFVGVSFPDTLYFDENNTPLLKAESGPFALALSNIAELENVEDAVVNVQSGALVYTRDKNIIVKGAQSSVVVYDIQGRFVTQTKVSQDVETISIDHNGCYLVLVDDAIVYQVIVR